MDEFSSSIGSGIFSDRAIGLQKKNKPENCLVSKQRTQEKDYGELQLTCKSGRLEVCVSIYLVDSLLTNGIRIEFCFLLILRQMP